MIEIRRNGGKWGSKFEMENKINRRCKGSDTSSS